MAKLSDNRDLNACYLREYAKSLPQAGAEARTTAQSRSNEAQNQTKYFKRLGKKPKPLVPVKEGALIEKSFLSRIFGGKHEIVTKLEANAVIVGESQILESKSQDKDKLADEMAVSQFANVKKWID